VVELVNGETGEPVRAQFVLAGSPVEAGTPLAVAAAHGATVDVVLPGFLNRQTIVRTGETRLALWPDTVAFPGDYTKSLVYTSASTTDSGAPAALRRLPTRVRTVAVLPSAGIQADGAAIAAHRAAVDSLNAATLALGVRYVMEGTGDLTVPTKVDPAYASCSALTRALATIWSSEAGEVTRAEITFCSEGTARSAATVAHELGHTFGLRHSTDPRDLMHGTYRGSRSTTPTPRELLTMALMRGRRAGTEWPDNDRSSTAAAARRFEEME
jgi:hypothetical protein